ncbi:hypothetical protein [Okeania sp.]|uniref:hypothetical protein n=1 Tax=Okeania sp. TaxID=3100323 RepID=UPI002B4B8A9D|nr:hypothetical protein [Okeania sp.]MEB3341565.1 hypothetical protein [Okeania sp.]
MLTLSEKEKPYIRKCLNFVSYWNLAKKTTPLKLLAIFGILKNKKRAFKEFVGDIDWGDYYTFPVGGEGGTLNLTLKGLQRFSNG